MSRADAAQLLHTPPAAGRGGGGGGERGGGGAGGDIAQRCTCETVDESTSTSTCLLALQVLSKYCCASKASTFVPAATWRRHVLGAAGTRFTCFNRTKVQILTPEEPQGLTQAYMKTGQTALAAAGTKALALLVHTHLLYSYKRTNTDRSGTRRGTRRSWQHVSVLVLSVLALPVQTYKC